MISQSSHIASTLRLFVVISLLHEAYSIELDFNDPNYDPENQDGIPVLSARGSYGRRSALASPTSQWRSNLGDISRVARPIDKRNSDFDPDDDEESDHRGSGSNNHDSYENPAYGESSRAAKDGDDIESFFDRHLGPPRDALESASTDDTQYLVPKRVGNQSPEQTSSSRDDSRADDVNSSVGNGGSDEDDDFMTAASSPLSALFHSFVDRHHHHHHKRPLIITTSAAPSPSAAPQSSPSASSTSASTDQATTATSSGAAIGIQQTTPAVASGAPAVYPETPSPVAYLSTVPAASTNVYDQSAGYTKTLAGDEGTRAIRDEDAPVRTIYIGRRPIIQYVRHTSSPITGAHATGATQLSNAYMRGSGVPFLRGAGDQTYEAAAMHDHRVRPMAADYRPQRFPPGMEPAAAGEGGSYPSEDPSDASDEGTVSYGLSFRRRPSSYLSPSDVESSPMDDSPQANEYENAQQFHPAGYEPRPGYGPMPATSTNNAYATPSMHPDPAAYRYAKYQPTPSSEAISGYMARNAANQMFRGPVLDHFAGSKYHKDPSESAPAAYQGQYAKYRYRARSSEPTEQSSGHASDWSQRQRLLASLSQEIKATPLVRRPQYVNEGSNVEHGASAAMQRGRNYLMPAVGVDPINPYMRRGHDPQTDTTSGEPADATSANGDGSSNDGGGHSGLQSEGSVRVPSRLDATATGGGINGSALVDNNSSSVNFSDSSAHQMGNGAIERNAITALGMSGEQSQVESPTESMTSAIGDTLRNSANPQTTTSPVASSALAIATSDKDTGNQRTPARQRVRREDSDDREADADDEDGVWVDDDGDDDNGQQSSDVNETAQDPDNERADDDQADNSGDTHQMRPSQQGIVAQPHGYELSPNDLMIYHG